MVRKLPLPTFLGMGRTFTEKSVPKVVATDTLEALQPTQSSPRLPVPKVAVLANVEQVANHAPIGGRNT